MQNSALLRASAITVEMTGVVNGRQEGRTCVQLLSGSIHRTFCFPVCYNTMCEGVNGSTLIFPRLVVFICSNLQGSVLLKGCH